MGANRISERSAQAARETSGRYSNTRDLSPLGRTNVSGGPNESSRGSSPGGSSDTRRQPVLLQKYLCNGTEAFDYRSTRVMSLGARLERPATRPRKLNSRVSADDSPCLHSYSLQVANRSIAIVVW